MTEAWCDFCRMNHMPREWYDEQLDKPAPDYEPIRQIRDNWREVIERHDRLVAEGSQVRTGKVGHPPLP